MFLLIILLTLNKSFSFFITLSRFFFQQQTRNVSTLLVCFRKQKLFIFNTRQARNLQPKFRFNRITFYEKCFWCMKVQAGDCWICPGLLGRTTAAWWKMWRIIFFQEIDSNGDVAFSINTHNLCCINRKCVF